MLCSAEAIYSHAGLIVIGNLLSLSIAVIMYFIAMLLNDERLKATANMTFVSIISTFVLIIVIIFILNLVCAIKVTELLEAFDSGLNSLNPSPKTPIAIGTLNPSSNNIYNFSMYYLSWAKLIVHKEIMDSRNAMAKSIYSSSINKWKCREQGLTAVLCLVGGVGMNYRPFMGTFVETKIYMMKINTLVASVFSVLTQMKLLLFIQYGFLDFLLPFAIVLRSLPGTRLFGSSLLALLLVMYVFYPLLTTFSAILWFPIVNEFGITYNNDPYLPLVQCIDKIDSFVIAPNNPAHGKSLMYMTFLTLATTIFIPTLQVIIMVALVKNLGRLIDSDIFTGKFFDVI